MKHLIFIFLAVIFICFKTNAQVPVKVFEITNILVDGCAGSDEGRNEMVLFRIGPNPVNVSDLRVDGAGATGLISTNRWPNTNNIWRGIAPPPAKPSEISQINATILNCGFLIEPVNGILPAGKNVLMITSTEFSTFAHSFTTLQDTLYVIFQNAGNTAGHFVNYGTPSSLRTMVLTHVPTNIGDTVIYDRSLLVNQLQQPGAQDGAAVAYDWPGNPEYYNNGCQAPYQALDASWTSPSQICSSNSVLDLSMMIDGTPGGTWTGTGVSGHFFNPAGLNGTYDITYTVGTPPCSVSETQQITVIESPSAQWTPPAALCSDASPVQLNTLISGTTGGTWSGTGVSGNTFNPSGLSGNYSITYTVSIPPCSDSETHDIQIIPKASAQWNIPPAFCDNSVPVQFSTLITGDTGGLWWGTGISNNLDGTFNPSLAGSGQHTVTYGISGACGDSLERTVIVHESPDYVLASTDESCIGQSDGSASLIVSNGTAPYSIEWSNLSDSDSIFNLSPGLYSFTITDDNLCQISGQVVIIASQEDCISSNIFVPNIFSPNGDQINDILYVRGPAITSMRFLIYNRWGQKMFESNNVNTGWNGQYKGLPAELGVYNWMLEAQLLNGNEVKKSGNVTLVR